VSEENVELVGPDFEDGVLASTLLEGMPVLGHVQGEPAIQVLHAAKRFSR